MNIKCCIILIAMNFRSGDISYFEKHKDARGRWFESNSPAQKMREIAQLGEH